MLFQWVFRPERTIALTAYLLWFTFFVANRLVFVKKSRNQQTQAENRSQKKIDGFQANSNFNKQVIKYKNPLNIILFIVIYRHAIVQKILNFNVVLNWPLGKKRRKCFFLKKRPSWAKSPSLGQLDQCSPFYFFFQREDPSIEDSFLSHSPILLLQFHVVHPTT